MYDPTMRLMCNIVAPPAYTRFRPGVPQTILHEPATTPPTTRLRLNFPGFPQWACDVASPRGVTVADVLAQLHAVATVPVGHPEHASFPPQVQTSGQQTFARRRMRDASAVLQRHDYLVGSVQFVGLVASAQGPGQYDVCLVPAE